MNKLFLGQYMKTEPTSTDKKYLFLVDSQDIAFAIRSILQKLRIRKN